MADLIDRQALLAEMRRSGRAAYMIVQEAPAVDAVEVVRCGECLHRYTGLRPNCHGRRPDWFCADGIKRPGGERREENAP